MLKKLYVIVFAFILVSSPITLAKTPLMIIIDDFGNNQKGTNEMLSLDMPLNIAVMPFLDSSTKEAELAYENGHEVLVHLPLEPKSGKASWLGPKPVTTNLSNDEIRAIVLEAIESVPHAKGMNNHTGSKATEDERVMRVVLEVCKEKGLYFIDSRTSHQSVVGKIAQEINLPYLENQLFFDHEYSREYMNRQAQKLLTRLNERPFMIAIGHVGIAGDKMHQTLVEYSERFKENASIMTVSQYLEQSFHLID